MSSTIPSPVSTPPSTPATPSQKLKSFSNTPSPIGSPSIKPSIVVDVALPTIEEVNGYLKTVPRGELTAKDIRWTIAALDRSYYYGSK